MFRVHEKKYFEMNEINTRFQCFLKSLGHLHMFWKHFKENMKTIFIVYILIISKNNNSSPNRQSFLRRVQECFST